jgi:hypothetical protein
VSADSLIEFGAQGAARSGSKGTGVPAKNLAIAAGYCSSFKVARLSIHNFDVDDPTSRGRTEH